MREINGISVEKVAENKFNIAHMLRKDAKMAHSKKPENAVSQT